MITNNFITAGKAIFTIECPSSWSIQHNSKPHYTYKITKKNDVFFVSLLTGPDNYSNYSYIGMLRNGQCHTTAKSKMTANSLPVRLLNRTLLLLNNGDLSPMIQAGFNVHHEGKCGRCGRRLTVPESIETGIGPECATKL